MPECERLLTQMRPSHRRFCEALASDPSMTQTKAYIQAFGTESETSACVRAAILIKKPHIQEYLAQAREDEARRIAEKYEITADTLTQLYKRIALFDVRKLFDEDGDLLPIHKLDDDTAAAIAGVDVAYSKLEGKSQEEATAIVLKKIKLADRLKAADSLARHISYFNDVVRVDVVDHAAILEKASSRAVTVDAQVAEDAELLGDTSDQ